MNSRAKFVVVMSSTCLVALLLLGGVVSKGAPADERASAAHTNVYRHLAVYSEVLSRIKSEYVEEPDMSSVTLGALNGLLESIDPYASYLNAEQYKDYLKNYDTYRGDLGMVLSKKFGYINVVSVIPGSPAAKAGLTTGDMLESIKGIATRDMPLAYARLLLKGQPGSTVDLSVLRRKPEPQKLTMTRASLVGRRWNRRCFRKTSATSRSARLDDHESGKSFQRDCRIYRSRARKNSCWICAIVHRANPSRAWLWRTCSSIRVLITYTDRAEVDEKISTRSEEGRNIVASVILTDRGTAAAAEVAAAALQGDPGGPRS